MWHFCNVCSGNTNFLSECTFEREEMCLCVTITLVKNKTDAHSSHKMSPICLLSATSLFLGQHGSSLLWDNKPKEWKQPFWHGGDVACSVKGTCFKGKCVPLCLDQNHSRAFGDISKSGLLYISRCFCSPHHTESLGSFGHAPHFSATGSRWRCRQLQLWRFQHHFNSKMVPFFHVLSRPPVW